MKNLFLSLTLLLMGVALHAQGNSITNRVIGKIQSDGTVKWNVSEGVLNDYLTTVLNSELNIQGTISQSTILFEKGLGYWVIQGQGVENNNLDLVRHIRVELEIVGNGNLKIRAQGTTETCTGNPCAECAFASGGGCTCKRTEESQVGINGKCNHTITKTSTK